MASLSRVLGRLLSFVSIDSAAVRRERQSRRRRQRRLLLEGLEDRRQLAGGILVSPISGNTTEAGGTATFTIDLFQAPIADVTIALSSDDTTEGTVSPASVTFTAADWSTRTVTVTGVDDSIDDGDVSFNIVTAAAVSADPFYSGFNASDVSVTNTDNDTAGITVSAISGNTTEAGGTATFTIVLDTQPTADVTIGLTSNDTTEGTVSPASVTFTSVNWNTPQTVTVKGVDDWADDGDVAYSIVTAAATSADGSYSGLNASDVAATTTDDDSAGTVAFTMPADAAATTFTLAVNGGNIELTSGGPVLATIPTSSTAAIVINGSSDDDTLVLNFAAGNPVPAGGLTFNGGSQTTIAGDDLQITGGSFTSLDYDLTGTGAGTITTTGTAATIAFTGLEPVTVTSSLGTVQIDVDPTNAVAGTNTVTISDAAGSNMTVGVSNPNATFESLTFSTPTVALIVNGDNVDVDLITISSVDTDAPFSAAVTINGQGGTDQIAVNSALSLGSGSSTGAVSLTAETVDVTQAISTTNVTTGSIAISATTANLSANLSTDGAGVTISASTAFVIGAATVTIDTESGNNGAAGSIDFTGTGLVRADAANRSLVLNSDSSGGANGAVTLVAFGSTGGSAVHDLTIDADDAS
ncbi:MAG TPA: hypothetical protein PLV92_15725, partial [Pirellulaceae bacterium]|nr:hypothetical protein [Pirellulaceae bacterium]